MRTLLAVSLSLAWIGADALAGTKAPPISDQAPVRLTRAPASAPACAPITTRRRARSPRPGDTILAQKQAEPARGPTDALTSCLAIWDSATHMTKQQWARACRRVAERLKDTTTK